VLDFRVLGPLEVVDDQGAVRLGGPKQRAVLAMLLLGANHVVPIDRLVDDLYGDASPPSALTQIHAHISELRRIFDPAREIVATRSPGYVLRLDPEQLDLRRFERLATEAAAASEPAIQAERLRAALALWRGPVLAEFADEPFARTAIARLQELRLKALEDRVEADLALGRHGEVAGELGELVARHPLRERLRAQLMIALYRSGRQAEALAVYRETRRTLVEEVGIEPGPLLQRLERAVLQQSPSLDLPHAASVRSVLVAASADSSIDSSLAVALPLVRAQQGELMLLRPVGSEIALASAAAAVNDARRGADVPARAAAFTTSDAAGDIVRIATSYDVAIVVLDAADDVLAEVVADVLVGSPTDVAIVTASVNLSNGDGVFVPFGGNDHDWAALELGAWLAASCGRPLQIVGPRSGSARVGDASRLLADASIAVQRLVDVDCMPVLADADELVDAVARATLVAVGLSPRWRRDGLGTTRRALLEAGVPVVLAHRGPRPGGLAPRSAQTRFTWSLQG
jgi:DNA-binding SARP family transcriptional activator